MKAEIAAMAFFLIISAVAGLPIIATHIDDSGSNRPNKCTDDAQCRAGNMCVEGACKSIFSCKPFVDAIWTNKYDLTAGGQLEVKNPEYLELLPLREITGGIGTDSAQYAIRFNGGPVDVHTTERVILKQFEGTKQVWGGSMLVRLDGLNFTNSFNSKLVLAGGYTAADWPNSTAGSWFRDFLIMPSITTVPPYQINDPRRAFGAYAYNHNAITVAPDPDLYPRGKPDEWPGRYINIDWYFTPSHNLYMRIDSQLWEKINTYQFPEEKWYKFRGFAAGWVSSYAGGSVEIKEIKLYDDSCLSSYDNR